MNKSLLSDKAKQFFFVIIKIAIVVIAFYTIYKRLVENSEIEISAFLRLSRENKLFSLKNILFLTALTTLNWFLEVLKWKILVNPVSNLNLKSAAEQSLGALTASLFTPNRIGEYGAKAIYYEAQNRKSILALNFLGNMMQMGTTVFFGTIGLVLFQKKHQTALLKIDAYHVLGVVSLLIILVVLILKTKKIEIGWLPAKLFSISRNSANFSVEKLKRFYQKIKTSIYVKGASISILRYFVFSFQFFVLLKIFGSKLDYLDCMITISPMYVLASVIPSIFIFDFVIKGSVALYLFAFSGINPLVVLSVVTLMWLLNFAFPSILGSYFVLNFKLAK
ncbi:MAG: hypothetical protein AAF688_12425 [Bacteroidota bacterium]